MLLVMYASFLKRKDTVEQCTSVYTIHLKIVFFYEAGSLPEIAGDCALYFNPDDTEECALAIESVITDGKLRERLIKSGFEWVKRFSWEKTAEKTIDLVKGECRES